MRRAWSVVGIAAVPAVPTTSGSPGSTGSPTPRGGSMQRSQFAASCFTPSACTRRATAGDSGLVLNAFGLHSPGKGGLVIYAFGLHSP